jgi:hypothetical protein
MRVPQQKAVCQRFVRKAPVRRQSEMELRIVACALRVDWCLKRDLKANGICSIAGCWRLVGRYDLTRSSYPGEGEGSPKSVEFRASTLLVGDGWKVACKLVCVFQRLGFRLCGATPLFMTGLFSKILCETMWV